MKVANLAKARILVTNDDGIHAPGLEALVEIATQLSSDVWIVAPEVNQSGAGHSLSLSRPIRAREVSEGKFAIDGTPTDCVLFAVKHLMKDRKPDLVLSGVNRGTNIADDVTYSGTIAAAMEGCLLGIPSIAFSQASRGFGGHIVERKDPRGGTYYWIGYAPQESEIDAASDIAAVRSGHISVTPLHLDLTHESMRRKLVAEFEAAPLDVD